MNPRFERTSRLVGEDGVARLAAASVMVVGLGGVGSYAFEAVARAGVGRLVLVDSDRVEVTNLNRQLLALDSTVGREKAEVARERLRDINPEARAEVRVLFVDEENVAGLLEGFDGWVIDAIDAVPSKVALLRQAVLRGIPVVSCMGAAGKLRTDRIQTADISETRVCPLARAVRQGLRACGVQRGVRCIFSDEPPTGPEGQTQGPRMGTLAPVTAAFGLAAAGEVLRGMLAAD